MQSLGYDQLMTRVYIADSIPIERSALRTLILDLKMEVVGEAADWLTTLSNAPTTRLDMLLVDWALLPFNAGAQAVAKLRTLCPNAIVVVLLNHVDIRQQAMLAADAFISKSEMPDRVADRLMRAAARTF
jgi:DNA-binding NarL/FixJ family response regulator